MTQKNPEVKHLNSTAKSTAGNLQDTISEMIHGDIRTLWFQAGRPRVHVSETTGESARGSPQTKLYWHKAQKGKNYTGTKRRPKTKTTSTQGADSKPGHDRK